MSSDSLLAVTSLAAQAAGAVRVSLARWARASRCSYDLGLFECAVAGNRWLVGREETTILVDLDPHGALWNITKGGNSGDIVHVHGVGWVNGDPSGQPAEDVASHR